MKTAWHDMRGKGKVFKTLETVPRRGDLVVWNEDTCKVEAVIWHPQNKDVDVTIVVVEY